MTTLHRYSAHQVLDAILRYKAREGEFPSQRALAVEADKSIGHINAQISILYQRGFIKLSKNGKRIIAAHSETPEQENT